MIQYRKKNSKIVQTQIETTLTFDLASRERYSSQPDQAPEENKTNLEMHKREQLFKRVYFTGK